MEITFLAVRSSGTSLEPMRFPQVHFRAIVEHGRLRGKPNMSSAVTDLELWGGFFFFFQGPTIR